MECHFSISMVISEYFFASLFPLQGSDPTAFSVLTQAITGQVGFMDVEFCTTCGEKGASKRCSVCKMVRKQLFEVHRQRV